MSKNDPIMQRMKENYEKRSRTYLTRRTPVIMRIDGKAFHTYTRGLNKPFDEGLMEDMKETAIYLCQNIQGAKCAYVQSDEISILVTDYDKLTTSAWFDYQIQKMVSVSASMATAKFNQLRIRREVALGGHSVDVLNIKLAEFDSRVFNIPKEEVANYFHARQRDAVKNSVSMLAQSLYSHKELEGKNQSDLQEMCFQKGFNWNDLHYSKKRGIFIEKVTFINGEKVEIIWNQGKDYQPFKAYPLIPGFRYMPELGIALKVDQDLNIEQIDNPIVRSQWMSTETPLSFSNNKIFKQWL